MRKLAIAILLVAAFCVGYGYAAKELRTASITIWDKNGDGVPDEVEVYWTVGTTDDPGGMSRNVRKRYTKQTDHFGTGNDLTYLGGRTGLQIVADIKADVQADEGL